MKVTATVAIKVPLSCAKRLMVYLVEGLNSCNVRSFEFMDSLGEKQLYDALREVIGGRRYEEIEKFFMVFGELSLSDQELLLFGEIPNRAKELLQQHEEEIKLSTEAIF